MSNRTDRITNAILIAGVALVFLAYGGFLIAVIVGL